MGTWFVGTRSRETRQAAEDAMKSEPACCDDLGRDAWVGFLKREGRWDDAACEVQDHADGFMIDGGGMVRTDEPSVSWEANGCKMRTFVRQIPFVIEVFKELKPLPEFPGVYGFRGFMRKYFLSPKTVQDSIPILERLLKGTESFRQELEQDYHRVFNDAKGRAFSARKCGCMSGLQYGDCCGKFVESAEQRKLRKEFGDRDDK